jgi:hypothetical protein
MDQLLLLGIGFALWFLYHTSGGVSRGLSGRAFAWTGALMGIAVFPGAVYTMSQEDHGMSQTELLLKEIEELPSDYVDEVIDFVGYLKHKASQSKDECPLCAKYQHNPNEETIAAIEEGRAMMRGEIPANRFHSLEELLADLRN